MITTLYGDKWAPAAGALQFLVVFGMVRVFAELIYDFLVAVGRTRLCFWLQVLWLLALAVLLPVGAVVGGIRGVAFMQAVAAVVVALPAYVIAVRCTGVALLPIFRALVRPVVAGLALVAVLVATRLVVDGAFLQLLIGGVLGAGCFVLAVWPLRAALLPVKLDLARCSAFHVVCPGPPCT